MSKRSWLLGVGTLVLVGLLLACGSSFNSSTDGLAVVGSQGSGLLETFSFTLNNGHISAIANTPTDTSTQTCVLGGLPSSIVIDPAGAYAYTIINSNSIMCRIALQGLQRSNRLPAAISPKLERLSLIPTRFRWRWTQRESFCSSRKVVALTFIRSVPERRSRCRWQLYFINGPGFRPPTYRFGCAVADSFPKSRNQRSAERRLFYAGKQSADFGILVCSGYGELRSLGIFRGHLNRSIGKPSWSDLGSVFFHGPSSCERCGRSVRSFCLCQ